MISDIRCVGGAEGDGDRETPHKEKEAAGWDMKRTL